MDEITFVDVLTHYQMKLKEAVDEVETVKGQVKQARNSIDMGWSGEAADACRSKLDTIDVDLTKTLTDLSEALIKLSAIGDLLAEGEINLV